MLLSFLYIPHYANKKKNHDQPQDTDCRTYSTFHNYLESPQYGRDEGGFRLAREELLRLRRVASKHLSQRQHTQIPGGGGLHKR